MKRSHQLILIFSFCIFVLSAIIALGIYSFKLNSELKLAKNDLEDFKSVARDEMRDSLEKLARGQSQYSLAIDKREEVKELQDSMKITQSHIRTLDAILGYPLTKQLKGDVMEFKNFLNKLEQMESR